MSKGADLGIAQARLRCHLQQCLIATPDPRSRVWRGDEGLGLLLGEKLDRQALVTFVRNRQNLLALKRARRLCVGDESEERAHGGETDIAGLRRAGTLELKMIEECAEGVDPILT